MFVAEVLCALACFAYGVYRCVRAQKQGEGRKALVWYISLPVLAFLGLWLPIILIFAVIMLVVIIVLRLLGAGLGSGAGYSRSSAAGGSASSRFGSWWGGQKIEYDSRGHMTWVGQDRVINDPGGTPKWVGDGKVQP